jgi:aspartyl-tRNA(Asn)/glutamyl-tRNA(Gln) amidotransferase subunit B
MAKYQRFQGQYELNAYDAGVLVAEGETADYFETVVATVPDIPPKTIANWIAGELFGLVNETEDDFSSLKVSPEALGELLILIKDGTINNATAKAILAEMFATGKPAAEIVDTGGLRQISDRDTITVMVARVLQDNPDQVEAYLAGKEGLIHWLFGQVMQATRGKANPQLVREALTCQLAGLKETRET